MSEAYLMANFEADSLDAPAPLAPIPATKTADTVRLAPWLPPGTNLNDQDPLPLLALNFEERGFEETDLPLVAYGDMLFDSPVIFGEPARSLDIACSTCHNRSDINKDLFIPGVSHQPGAADVDSSFFNPIFNAQRADSLDIPSLRGIRFTAPYGRNGHFGSLRDFTRNIIVNEFAGEEPTPFMLDALVTYMLEFDWQPNSLLNNDAAIQAIYGREVNMDLRPVDTPMLPGPRRGFLSRASHAVTTLAYPRPSLRQSLLHTIQRASCSSSL